jgi:hypothetical protein
MPTLRFALPILLIASLSAAPRQSTFVVRRPTVFAFFPPVTQKDLEHDPDTNEALSDFHLYATRARQAFGKLGIDFTEVYAWSFRVSIQGKITSFTPGPDKVGYYFIAPDKKPRVEYGVKTDSDLLQIATEYFNRK